MKNKINIPLKWTLNKVSDFGKVYTGNTPPTKNKENYGNEYLFVGPFDLNNVKYISKTEKRLSKKGLTFLVSFLRDQYYLHV